VGWFREYFILFPRLNDAAYCLTPFTLMDDCRTANVFQRLLGYVFTRGVVIAVLQILSLTLYLAAPSRLYW
jgi:hypothetical protein